MKTTSPRTKVEVSRQNKVTYVEREVLFSLIKWWQKVRVDKIQDDLIIETSITIGDIYLNGKKIN